MTPDQVDQQPPATQTPAANGTATDADAVADTNTGTDRPAEAGVSRREGRWVLKRCAKRGHILAHLDDADLAERFSGSTAGQTLLRCLRCGDFVVLGAAPPPGTTVIGTPSAPAPLSQVPLAVRGGHGRKLALLRVLAIERGGRGTLLLVAAAGIARLAGSHVAVADWLAKLAKAAQPLGQQLGWNPGTSATLTRVHDLLGRSDHTFVTTAWLLSAYGVLELIEGVGLWGGWLWAEYLTAVATAVFIPLEVYEITDRVTALKIVALLINVAAVVYLVFKGRLFGVRGGHPAYLAEVRDSTLLAADLRAADRPTDVLTSHDLV